MTSAFEIIPTQQGKRLRITGDLPPGFHGEGHGDAWLCPLDAPNAAALRRALPWTGPTLVGLRKSVGCGDRLGLATQGHILAVRDTGIFAVFAQQSIREMNRASRSAQQVFDDATWAVLEMDYQAGWGCDADHLKTTEAIDTCIAAGFIGFTLDPSDHVDNAAQTDGLSILRTKYAALPWEDLQTTPEELLRHYDGPSPVGELTAEVIYRAACKYSRALAHVAHLARHITSRLAAFDLEVSVDETDTPTSPAEHYFIAAELKRLEVLFHGLAPRFIGRFEKGVDYIGDLNTFEQDYIAHARIARELGPYKLSIHSGSDKFSLYPIIARHSRESVHLKTAGTSWLEALRVISTCQPTLFRDLLQAALGHYETDKASYHVSAQVAKIQRDLPDAALPGLLDQFDARQVVHVTFGSLINQFRAEIHATLLAHETDYRAALRAHFERHLTPFKDA